MTDKVNTKIIVLRLRPILDWIICPGKRASSNGEIHTTIFKWSKSWKWPKEVGSLLREISGVYLDGLKH
ncbi:hypothetical protein Nepgr_032739 [Nepenthes gracilis]|uniref:Uncharacterized protein n=1 Tax=Nepenthes gracilis TaxID=150966 RepID=A0AAD3TKN4_NEPGR|nr:hypothetical protein Nepgr_032739 [Nepenthes gracilis]